MFWIFGSDVHHPYLVALYTILWVGALVGNVLIVETKVCLSTIATKSKLGDVFKCFSAGSSADLNDVKIQTNAKEIVILDFKYIEINCPQKYVGISSN